MRMALQGGHRFVVSMAEKQVKVKVQTAVVVPDVGQLTDARGLAGVGWRAVGRFLRVGVLPVIVSGSGAGVAGGGSCGGLG
jgi:hypothetical protein